MRVRKILPSGWVLRRAKGEGRHKGRMPTAMVKSRVVLALAMQGNTREVAEKLGIGVASVYRVLKETKMGQMGVRGLITCGK